MPDFNVRQLCEPQWEIGGCEGEQQQQENYVAEQLEISGAKLNIFKLLGVHEQGKLIDLVGNGNPISSGTAPGYVIDDAYRDSATEWHSSQTGAAVLDGFIGYNFGVRTTNDGFVRHAPAAPVMEQIGTIRIQQGPNPENRVTQARIERSVDGGATWKRVDVVELPDTDEFEFINIRPSAMAQLLRIVPIQFNGLTTNDPWVVVRLELMDYQATRLSNIQDPLFRENRDRDYADASVEVKAHYDILDLQTEFAKFGIDIPQQYVFTISFAKMVQVLGRPIVIGDIIELPSEMQYDANLNGVRKWLEVEDTGWSTEGFTPGWKPTLFRFNASPLLASQETRDVIGIEKNYIDLSDGDFLSGELALDTAAHEATEYIVAESEEAVPETGTDASDYDVDDDTLHDIASATFRNTDLYVENGLPPNGEPYTEDMSMPENPSDGDYHRLIYPADTNIPPRLFQWNEVKMKWLFLEADNRWKQNSHKPSVDKILKSQNKVDLN